MKAGRARAWLIATSIFALGLTVGVAGTTWIGVRLVKRAVVNFPEGGGGLAERASLRLSRDLSGALDLTEAEQARVDAEIATTMVNLRDVRVDAAREMRAELRVMVMRIAATLPEEKRPAFRQHVRERLERFGFNLPSEPVEPKP